MVKKEIPVHFPDLILIGAPEAGGDIIKSVLKEKAEVWFPPVDNIIAFHPGFQITRLETLKKYLRRELPFNIKDISWLAKYLLRHSPSATWYSSLFRIKRDDVLRAEFSDEYMTSPFDIVEKLGRLMPDTKIVLMVRHPADRSFASLRKKFAHNVKTPFSTLSKRQLISLMNSDWSRSHSNYLSAIDSWAVFFKPENLFVGFYDELVEDGPAFFNRLFTFLGYSEFPDIGKNEIDLLLPATELAFPKNLRPHLHPFYYQQIHDLAERLGRYAKVWASDFPLPQPKNKHVLSMANEEKTSEINQGTSGDKGSSEPQQ